MRLPGVIAGQLVTHSALCKQPTLLILVTVHRRWNVPAVAVALRHDHSCCLQLCAGVVSLALAVRQCVRGRLCRQLERQFGVGYDLLNQLTEGGLDACKRRFSIALKT